MQFGATCRSAARVGALLLLTVVVCAITITSINAAASPSRPVVTSIATYVAVPPPRAGHDSVPDSYVVPPAARTLRDLRYGPAPHQLLDLYLPDTHAFPGPRPVLLWLHAGGWTSRTRRDTTPAVQREVARGFAVASVEYALAPAHPFPAPLEDVKLAIRWAKTVGARYHLDPKKVIAAGGSAGAYLAAMAAVTPGRFEPRAIPAALARAHDTVAAVVDFVGPTNLVTFDAGRVDPGVAKLARSMGAALLACAGSPSSTAAARPCPTGREREASVAPYLSRHSPPIFLAYGATDVLVAAATQEFPLARAWAAMKRPNSVWVQVLQHVGHNVTLRALNDRAFDRFLSGVVSGSIR